MNYIKQKIQAEKNIKPDVSLIQAVNTPGRGVWGCYSTHAFSVTLRTWKVTF